MRFEIIRCCIQSTHTSNTIWDLGCRPTVVDPDVQLKLMVKPSGFKHYKMASCHVDDAMVMSENPMHTINGMKVTFKLKGDKAKVPDMCLGGNVGMHFQSNQSTKN